VTARGWPRRRAAAFAAALLVAALALTACGGSTQTERASSSPTASPSVAGRPVAPTGWGIQFLVADRFSQTDDVKDASGTVTGVRFRSAASHEGGGLIMVSRVSQPEQIDVDTWIRYFGDRKHLAHLLPRGVGKLAGFSFWRKPEATTIGPGWPGFTARYWVVLTPGSKALALFGQRTLACETTVFWHEGHAYAVDLIAMPYRSFARHRAELELTLQTMAPAQ